MEGLFPQAFSGNGLCRTAERDPDFIRTVIDKSSILLVAGRKVGVQSRGDGVSRRHSLAWLTARDLSDFGIQQEQGVLKARAGKNTLQSFLSFSRTLRSTVIRL